MELKEKLYHKLFTPNILGVFINVFYLDRSEIYKSIKSLSKYGKGKLLDVGCSNKPYEHLFNVDSYIGLEIDTPYNRKNKKADFFYDGKQFPFENNSFDIVLSSQVLEHVDNPEEFILNINKVLITGGGLIISVPFIGDEHEIPYDYRRYTSFGLKYILEKNGFQIIEQYKTTIGFPAIIQLFMSYCYKYIRNKPKFLSWILQIIISTIFNPIGLILSIFPGNQELFLGNTVYARKIS